MDGLIIEASKLIRVYHKRCGRHVAFIIDAKKPKSDMSNFYLLNMRHPNPSDKMMLGCLGCGKYITKHSELIV